MIEICRKEPVNRNSSDSELIAVALMATRYFRDNIDHTISFVKCTSLLPGCYHDIFSLSLSLSLFLSGPSWDQGRPSINHAVRDFREQRPPDYE